MTRMGFLLAAAALTSVTVPAIASVAAVLLVVAPTAVNAVFP